MYRALKAKKGRRRVRSHKSQVPGAKLALRFPINEERRLNPQVYKEFAGELAILRYPEQEAVCQIISSYRAARSPAVITSLAIDRRELRAMVKELESLAKQLPDPVSIEVLAEGLRSIHRPEGVPRSVREFFRLVIKDDYVPNQKTYFQIANLPDPAKTLDDLIVAINTTLKYLRTELGFIRSRMTTLKSVRKAAPHLWWQSGGIYYLLDRIFREGASVRQTQGVAHRKIITLMRKLDGSRLKFDKEKGYCPAIRSAIDRMSTDYKRLCDGFLQEWLGLPLKVF